MRHALSTLALVLAALGCSPASADVACSSINGPFCVRTSGDANSGMFGAAVAPRHAAAPLDQDTDQTKEQLEVSKRANIERVLKQYELEAALNDASDLGHDDDDDMMNELDMLLDSAAALFVGDENDNMGGEYEESPVVGTFAFNNEGGVFEELDRMDGADLKEFFELALEEVVQSYTSTLDDMSPEISQGLLHSVQQLKAVKDFAAFRFHVLDDVRKAQIRHKFTHHRLIEVQQTFEKMVIARNARERQYALEASVFLFQLAHESAATADQDAPQKAAADAAPSADVAGT